MDEFEKIFQKVTSVVLGKKLAGYLDYGDWLLKNVIKNAIEKSVISGEPVYVPRFNFYYEIKNNLVTIPEAYEILGKRSLSTDELRKLSVSNSGRVLKNICTTTSNTIYGENSNMVESTFYYNSHSCFRSSALNRCKYSLYSFWPRQSDYTLGCHYLFSSQFCIKCYNSENLNRCFELSDCTNCTDSMFCHNCENLANCMFCFNAKAKKYAIANVEVGQEKYMEIKEKILNEITGKLERDKNFDLNIYNIGSHRIA